MFAGEGFKFRVEESDFKIWVYQKGERDAGSSDLELYINMQRFRGGLVLQAHRLRVSLDSRFESKIEEEKKHDLVDSVGRETVQIFDR